MKYFLALIIGFILEITIFSFYPVAGVKPDPLLVIVIITGLLTGVKGSIFLGFLAGTLQDLFLGGMLGVFTIIKMVVAGFSGLIGGHFFKENYFFPSLLIFGITFVHETLVLLFKGMLFNINYFKILQTVIIPEGIYNAILGFVLYIIFYKLEYAGERYYE